MLPWFQNTKSAAFWAVTNSVHLLTGKSIFLPPPNRAAFCTSQQYLYVCTPGSDIVISLRGCKRQETPPCLQISHSLCKGTGQKLFNMLMSSIKHNPQTSATSLHECPSKIKSLTNSNQYFHYCFKLAAFCFTSNPNCFLSTT